MGIVDVAERATFRNLQNEWLLHSGLSFQSRMVPISRPAMQAHVLDVGTGEPALLVHGGGGFAALWAPLMRTLHGVRLLAVDRPGFGLSDGFDHRGVDLKSLAVDFLSSILDVLGLDRVPLIANSMGGSWAFWLALEHPHRVSAIVQLGCPANLLGSSAPLPFRLLGLRALNKGMLAIEPPSHAQAVKTFQRMGHAESIRADRLPPEMFNLFAAGEALPTYATAWLSLLERTVRLRGARPEAALTSDQLSRIVAPTLFLWGARDPFGSPELGQAAVAAMPNARIEVIRTGGHLPWLDAPERCAASTAEFIAGQSG